MSDVIISPNMSLPVPIVGVDPGPDWANNINACLGILDEHDHSPGQGVKVTPNGLNINIDLTMNGNNLTAVKTVNFTAQGSPIPGTAPNLGAIYVAGNELYYNDESGNMIQITLNGAVNAGAGSISGLPSGTASVSYVSGNQTYVFQSATNTAGNIDAGSIIIREVAALAKGITLSSPTGLAADYTLTFPPALPASQQVIAVDPSGTMSFITLGGAIVGPGGYTTITAAIAATSANDYISVSQGTYTENVTLSSPRTIVGQGRGTVVNGTWTFASGSSDSLVKQLKFGGNVTINSGVTEIQLNDSWVGNGFTVTDNGPINTNLLEWMQE